MMLVELLRSFIERLSTECDRDSLPFYSHVFFGYVSAYVCSNKNHSQLLSV